MRLRLPAAVVALTVTCSLIQVASSIGANHPNLRMDQGEIDALVRAMLIAEDPSIRGSFSMNLQDDASFHEQSGFQWRPNRYVCGCSQKCHALKCGESLTEESLRVANLLFRRTCLFVR